MVGVVMRTRNDIHTHELIGSDDPFGYAGVGLVRGGIFVRKRIGKVRIEEDGFPVYVEKETTLAEPPKAAPGVGARGGNVGQEDGVLLERRGHNQASP